LQYVHKIAVAIFLILSSTCQAT